MTSTARNLTTSLLYTAGLAQGLALVTFPAASSIFTSPSGFNLSSAQYGGIFIPQVALAIAASAFAPWLARFFGLRSVLFLGLCADLLSMALLSSCAFLMHSALAFFILCAATGALGFGFGATVMALNTLTEFLFPRTVDQAVLVLNALLGLGTALAPIMVALFTAFGAWWALPLLVVILEAVLLVVLTGSELPPNINAPAGSPVAIGLSVRFWLYAAGALLYGLVETLNGNWATVYLIAERHMSPQQASFALSAFWVAVTLGRVIFAIVERWISARTTYIALPVFLAFIFQIAAHAQSPIAGIGVFAAAGVACSVLLPLSISFSGAEFPRRTATMSGELIASYQVGYGIAAFAVGPLHEFAGVAFSTTFSFGSLAALALAAVAWLVAAGAA